MLEKLALLNDMLITVLMQVNLQLVRHTFLKLFLIKIQTLNLMFLNYNNLNQIDLGYCRIRKISFSCVFILQRFFN